jgi:hypothetical protein
VPAVRRLVGKFDPAERDARNRDLGKAGERFVVESSGTGCGGPVATT